jgi:penicillin-binding protein 2
MVDVHGREKGPMRGGRIDTTAVAGKNITLTLDIDLQSYGELLMQNKSGSIVAIEPSTGEILSMVSSPGYDPALLVGRGRSRNFPGLSNDTLFPLLNRAIMSGYPPGSTFKAVMALIGLQEGVLRPSTSYSCNNGFHARGIHIGCHPHPLTARSGLFTGQFLQCLLLLCIQKCIRQSGHWVTSRRAGKMEGIHAEFWLW